MTQEEKDLLLKDLCARLPYGIKCIEKTPTEEFQDKNLWEIDRIRKDIIGFGVSNCYVCYGQYVDIDNIKPYLFPLSSMTEEQSKELEEIDPEFYSLIRENGDICVSMDVRGYDWLNKYHFDYRGLIRMGLAIDCTNLNVY